MLFRSGRTEKRGKVIIQTYNPFHQILQQASMNKYDEMFSDQLNERKQYRYPPFFRLIKLTFKHRDYNKTDEATNWFAQALRNTISNYNTDGNLNLEVLGPESPPIGRVRNEYIKNVLIKLPPGTSVKTTKEIIKKIGKSFHAIAQYRSVRVIINVDNY